MSESLPRYLCPRETEQRVLGAMMRDPATAVEVLTLLTAEDFYYDPHPDVFRALAALVAAQQPCDAAAALHWLGTGGNSRREARELAPYLAECWEMGFAPSHAVSLARIVLEVSLKHKLDLGLAEALECVRGNTGTFPEMLQQVEGKLFGLANRELVNRTYPLEQALQEAADHYDEVAAGRAAAGVPTGFERLDRLTAGLHPSELIVLAARPSLGKTAFAVRLIRNVAAAGVPVFFASIEQSRRELADRFICSEGLVNSQRLRLGKLTDAELERHLRSREALDSLRVFIDDGPRQSLWRITANARRHKLRDGIGLVVVDYLQLVDPPDPRQQRNEQVAQVSRGLKALARELRVPVLALAQLNRGVEGRTDSEPRLSDLRDSGQIEQDGDVVMFLHRESDAEIWENETRRVEINLLVRKQRNGPRGEVCLDYYPDHLLFSEPMEKSPFD